MSYAAATGMLRGFGYDVPYRDDRTGDEGLAVAGTGPNCGDPYGVQVMLYWLGFYPGPIDGNASGPGTRAALLAYATSRGIAYNPQSPPSGELCSALIADHEAYWQQGTAAAAGQCPPGQWGVPPLCVGTPAPERPAEADGCPSGTVGLPPYCVAVPGALPSQPPAGSACPEGTVGMAPYCYGVPSGLPTIPPATTPGTEVPKGPPPPSRPTIDPTDLEKPPPAPSEGGWWASRSKNEKTAILVGGALVGLMLVAVMMKPTRATPNRHKRYRPNRRAATAPTRARRKTTRRKPKRRRSPKGKVIMLKSGRRFGRGVPAKRYRRKGFVKRSQYAWPEGYMYPIADYKHCKNALSRFQRNKTDYPPHVRKVIAHNILYCAKKQGMVLSDHTQKSLFKDAKRKSVPTRMMMK